MNPPRRNEPLYQDDGRSADATRRLEEALRQERVDIMKEGIGAWMEEHAEEQRDTIKQAIDEWLDRQVLKFGRFSIWFVIAAAAAAVLYLWLLSKGFKG